jgi:hypothetical protein
MSYQDSFKIRLNTNIANLSSSDIRLMLKELYKELEKLTETVNNLKTSMDKQVNETRNLSQDRPKVGRPIGKDVSTT